MYKTIIGISSLVLVLCVTVLIYKWSRQETFQSAKKYRLLVSAQCRPYQDWQALGVWWSAKQVWPEAIYTRLLSCNEQQRPEYDYHTLVPTFLASDWEWHPITKDHYPPYNRPIAILEYLQKTPNADEYLVIVDPDIIFRKPMDSIPISLEKPVAQRYEYLNNDDGLQTLARKFLDDEGSPVQPIGMPIIIHRTTLSVLAPLWVSFTEKIRDDPDSKKLVGWTAEMHGYCLAAAKIGLQHIIRDDLADRTPYDRIQDPFVLHYDLVHQTDDFKWDKRNYFTLDLLDSAYQFPIPKKPPNERFLQVFETLNAALHKKR
jgi:hypothetical protein